MWASIIAHILEDNSNKLIPFLKTKTKDLNLPVDLESQEIHDASKNNALSKSILWNLEAISSHWHLINIAIYYGRKSCIKALLDFNSHLVQNADIALAIEHPAISDESVPIIATLLQYGKTPMALLTICCTYSIVKLACI